MKKRVALVYTFGSLKREVSFLGGAERRINYIFSNIRNPSIDIELVFVLRQNRDSVMRLLETYLNDDTKIQFVDSYRRLFFYLVKRKFDIVCYVDCVIQTLPAIIGSTIARSKRIMIVESSNRAYGVFKRGWKERVMMRWNFRHSNHLDTLYPSSKPLLEKRYGNDRRKVTVTPCTLPRLERYYRITEKDNIILFAGRLNENKNPELFVRAAIECADDLRAKRYKCMLCGDGPLKEKLKTIVDESDCSDVIVITGYVNMEEITPQCRVFCSLQHTENYPSQSLLEAITSGCYCICTDSGDTKVLVKPEFGELIDESASELAQVFRQTLAFDYEKWKLVEETARKFALENFDVQKAVRHYEEIFLQ